MAQSKHSHSIREEQENSKEGLHQSKTKTEQEKQLCPVALCRAVRLHGGLSWASKG
jgi:hypothetical protein